MTESNRIEYKRELTDNLEKEVVAFLNSKEGGIIHLGIDKEGVAYGVVECDKVQLAIKDRLKNNIQPSIMGLFEIILEKVAGKELIRIVVAAGLEKPYYLKKYGMTEKGCFLRVGSAAEPMPQEMIDSLYGRRIRNTIGRIESTRHNLTFEQLHIYYSTRGLKLNDAFMNNLELLTPEGKANYAAYLLADENGISIQVAKYAGITRVDLVENRDFGRCSLIKALKGVLERMDVENTIFTRIGYPLRQEREMIDSTAMREAVINTIVHYDYSNGASPKFEFFSDRLEITSAGGLPYGVTEQDFFNGYSTPRNKEIMRVFRDLEIVEHLGSGIPRILERYGRDVFEIGPNFLRVIFKYEQSFGMEPVEGLAEGVESGAESRLESRLAIKVLLRLNNGDFGKAALAEHLGHKTVSGELHKQIKRLLENALIEMTIPDKPNSRLQKYRLTEKGKSLLAAGDGGHE